MGNVNKYHAVLVKISLYGPHLKKKKKKLLKNCQKLLKILLLLSKAVKKVVVKQSRVWAP